MGGKCPPTKEGHDSQKRSDPLQFATAIASVGQRLHLCPPKGVFFGAENRICRRRLRTRRASTRRTPPATFLPGRCHRWPRGWPQTPVRTTPHLVGRGEATVEIEDDRFGPWPVALD